MQFPIGYRVFHGDPSLNFELNRWLSVLPEGELSTLATRIHTLADWKPVMLAAATAAEATGATLEAAFYFRAAEFFTHPGDPDKELAYERFVQLFDRALDGFAHQRQRVPYQSSWLPAVVLPARGREKETVLLHGGFDSFLEEFVEWGSFLTEAGYRVVLFEGPGQGAALRKSGLVMGPDWERPVGAVLDHFGIDRCTILGVSLGGYLAPRAAAFEPRIRRVIAFDVLDDFFDCFAARAGEELAQHLRHLLSARQRDVVNEMMSRLTATNPATAWTFAHGMHVSGARDPFEFLCWAEQMNTAPFSARITQDCLLLAGAGDHIVPLRQFHRQVQNLPNARSLTGRIFTASEHADNHCQIGNVGLALRFMVTWLDFQLAAETEAPVAG
ncbi:MAG: alpha/beta hydrolase family protein [Candidatus Binatia bacterium]